MAAKPWQLKPVASKAAGTDSQRHTKKSEKGGRTTEAIIHKRAYKRHRGGYWFMHGSAIYTLWWEFFVRAYQASDIEVDREQYKDWGTAKSYMDVDIWNGKSRAEASKVWWKEHGRYLFAEHDDRGVELIGSGENHTVPNDKFCLEIPVGTPANEMMNAIKRIVRENVHTSKTSHVSTAPEHLTANEIRPDAYRRWLKIWDMKNVPGCPNFDKYPAEAKKGNVFSMQFINEIHGTDGNARGLDANSSIYRHVWRAKHIVQNVAIGHFP